MPKHELKISKKTKKIIEVKSYNLFKITGFKTKYNEFVVETREFIKIIELKNDFIPEIILKLFEFDKVKSVNELNISTAFNDRTIYFDHINGEPEFQLVEV